MQLLHDVNGCCSVYDVNLMPGDGWRGRNMISQKYLLSSIVVLSRPSQDSSSSFKDHFSRGVGRPSLSAHNKRKKSAMIFPWYFPSRNHSRMDARRESNGDIKLFSFKYTGSALLYISFYFASWAIYTETQMMHKYIYKQQTASRTYTTRTCIPWKWW